MKIVFWGTSEFVGSLQRAGFLRGLVAAGVKPILVVTAPDREQGPGAVKSAAAEFGIPVLQPTALKNIAAELAAAGPDLSLVAAYGKILPSDLLSIPKFGSLNVHPSLLPRWRGPTPIQTTILAGDSVSGATIIQMDEQMDHGPIVAQREFPLGNRPWTAPEISDALTSLGVDLFLEVVEPWIRGEIVPQPQDHEAATYCPMLKKEDGRISWEKSAEEIERMVRAFQPWPGACAIWPNAQGGVRLSLEEVIIRARASGANPGTVFSAQGKFLIAAENGAIEIVRLKPAGGSSMSGVDFIRGHKMIIGQTLN